jgi:hypothetical protein
LIAVVVSYATAIVFGLPTGKPIYRRIGPTSGPQVFCAGSSLIQMGLQWSVISNTLGKGVENWGVGGSTPEIWEIGQRLADNSNFMIVGVSLYDLNEFRLCDSRAQHVPLSRTIKDLWRSRSGWQFSKRVLSQYALAVVRFTFPTAGKSDAVLVGAREKVRHMLHLSDSKEDSTKALVLPPAGVLDFGEDTSKLSDLSEGRLRRRMAMMRVEIQGRHEFAGPKMEALRRMLAVASEKGRIVVIVMPVSQAYLSELVDSAVLDRFDAALDGALKSVPGVQVIRLDRLPELQSNDLYSDPVHLNSAGRGLATAAVLSVLKNSIQSR